MNIPTQLIDSMLQQADIEGLIQAGAPSDEYLSEAEIISAALTELEGREVIERNISSIILEVWKESFDLDAIELQKRQNAFNDVADLIMKNHQKMTG